MKKMKAEIKRNVNSRSLLVAKEEDLIKNLNPKIIGWRIIILPKQMRNGCRHWTGTLFVLSQDGTTRNTKAEIICRKWDLLGIAFTKKD